MNRLRPTVAILMLFSAQIQSVGADEWGIAAPVEDATFSTEAVVAGDGVSSHPNQGFTAEVQKQVQLGGNWVWVILSSESGQSDAESEWNISISQMSGSWPEGPARFLLRCNSEEESCPRSSISFVEI